MKKLGNDYSQLTGHYFLSGDLKSDINSENLQKVKNMEEQNQINYVSRIMEKDKDCKSYNDKQLYPCNSTVIVLPYDKNPYRQPLRETSSGLLIGDFESTATYKSKETGEEESSKRGIWCCKVIAVGPNCKNVNVDDDVYVNFLIAVPVPFGNKGYYALSEQNIICAIR